MPNLAGGSSDLIARAVAAHLSKVWGQPVVIDNKPGASEMIATEFLARAAPDGYTIAIFSNALSINETLSPARRYDAKRDLIAGDQARRVAVRADRRGAAAGQHAQGIRRVRQEPTPRSSATAMSASARRIT